MKIELNGIALDGEGEGGEGRSVKNITTEDARNVEAYDAPGTQGSSYNDQGRSAVKLAFEGTVVGKDARTLLESIWSCFKKGDPVDFYSDISGAADITKVLIESFVVTGAAGDRNRYDYAIGLWEYKEPPEEPDIPGGEPEEGAEEAEDEAKKGRAEKWADRQAIESEESLNTLTGKVLNDAGEPVGGVRVRIVGRKQELSATTDAEGVYTVSNLDPGVYVITVEAEGFEDEEEEVVVG
ncbi:MAG: hypothetical protein A4E28_00500 [Methanocella sp. PtaU1.Bin125]|nr:MAG: hypothetical protein A4E28_00500 [Methanocella sp. PtaU1.Bin125]